MQAKLITAPVSYPVSLAEVKAHVRAADFSDDDDLLTLYRAAAIQEAERFTGRAFQDQTWDLYLDEFPEDGEPITLPNPPLIAVTGIWTLSSDGSESALTLSDYMVDTISEPARLSLPASGSWPTAAEIANAVRIRFRAGYVDEDASPVVGEVPYPIRAAILISIGDLYSNRESVVVGQSVSALPKSAQNLLRPYRIHTAIG